MDITRIDGNFSTEPADENGFLFRDVKLPPFRIEGLAWYGENGGAWYRLPKTFTEAPPASTPEPLTERQPQSTPLSAASGSAATTLCMPSFTRGK